jgi:CBS domain-containing protein
MAALKLKPIKARTLALPGHDPWHADRADPALTVMTDFRERASVTVSDLDTIDDALLHMKHTGVRCAFVVDDAARAVVGMITAYDITSEKPMRHMHSVEEPRRAVRVRDIMQPIADWRVLDIRDVEASNVGAIARLFDQSRLTHIAVMEAGENGEPRLRGLLSAARVRRLLG